MSIDRLRNSGMMDKERLEDFMARLDPAFLFNLKDYTMTSSEQKCLRVLKKMNIITPNVKRGDIVGNDKAKTLIEIAITPVDPVYTREDITGKPLFIVLTGEPGTGKTLFAKYAATILKRKLALIRIDALMSGMVGGNEQNIAEFFDALPLLWKDYVVLLDEADSLLGVREKLTEGFERRVVDIALIKIDELNGNNSNLPPGSFMFMTSNEALDPAILRRCIPITVELPSTLNDYKKILYMYASKFHVNIRNYLKLASRALEGKVSPARIELEMKLAVGKIGLLFANDEKQFYITEDFTPGFLEVRLYFENYREDPKEMAENETEEVIYRWNPTFGNIESKKGEKSCLPEKLQRKPIYPFIDDILNFSPNKKIMTISKTI